MVVSLKGKTLECFFFDEKLESENCSNESQLTSSEICRRVLIDEVRSKLLTGYPNLTKSRGQKLRCHCHLKKKFNKSFFLTITFAVGSIILAKTIKYPKIYFRKLDFTPDD